MSMNTAEQFQIPPEMRALAEKSVEQAKQAVEGFISAAQRTVCALEGQAETARKGAKDVGGKAMGFAEQNIATSFEFAQKVVRAKDIHEFTQLQTEFVKAQISAFAEQAKALGQTVAKDSVRLTA